jgi:hypothetical protein
VVSDSSRELGKIHVQDRLIAYANRHFGEPLNLNVAESEDDAYGSRRDCLKDAHGLQIVFHRTIRMPDDDKMHQLPGSLGAFPLFNVSSFAEKLPAKMVKEGGVFLPMWQREALWIQLESTQSKRYALRISLGHINAISGAPMNEDQDATSEIRGKQDYVVVPGQEWIDGICVAPGIVRQFVAMPRESYLSQCPRMAIANCTGSKSVRDTRSKAKKLARRSMEDSRSKSSLHSSGDCDLSSNTPTRTRTRQT